LCGVHAATDLDELDFTRNRAKDSELSD
jgi:hypothetical protein